MSSQAVKQSRVFPPQRFHSLKLYTSMDARILAYSTNPSRYGRGLKYVHKVHTFFGVVMYVFRSVS